MPDVRNRNKQLTDLKKQKGKPGTVRVGLVVVVSLLSQRNWCDWLIVQALYHQGFFQFPNEIQI